MCERAKGGPDDVLRDAVREGYYRILLGQGKKAARQFVVDWLLAEPGAFLEWVDASADRLFRSLTAGSPLGALGIVQAGWLFEPFFSDRAGLPTQEVDGLAVAVEAEPTAATALRRPDWLDRYQRLKQSLFREVAFSPFRSGGGFGVGGAGSLLKAALHLGAGGAPPGDYQIRPSPAAVAEFVFRGGAFAPAADGSRAMAHGVWLGRGHTWCDTPVSADDSLPVYSRTARGFLRLPSRCPECERFLRGMVEGEGGSVRSFVLLQRLDMPETLPPAVLALLDDAGVQFGDDPVPEDTGDGTGG